MPNLLSFTKKYITLIIIFGLLFITLIPTLAKSQDLQEIKVHLISGKSDYEQIISLSSKGGINIESNNPTPFTYEGQADEEIGFQYDRYYLQLVETIDLSKVKSIIEQVEDIDKTNFQTTIEVVNKNKKTYYRVILVGFNTTAELNELKQLIKDEIQITGKTQGQSHWTLGEFNNSNDANSKIQELADKGFEAYLAQVFEKGEWKYHVWVGESIPNLTLKEVNSSTYVIHKQNGYINKGKLVTYPSFVFSQSAIVNIRPGDISKAIQVRERKSYGLSNSYRGEFFIQLYNDEIAVVNQLSLETYLYSVVGSEVYSSFPIEVFKSQAVAARTFAYSKLLNPRSSIANIYDTIDDQAYYGVDKESDGIRKAVDETNGLVILYNGKPISTFYHSNAGGMTSEGSEVWGSNIPYVSVKSSSQDNTALTDVYNWYRILRKNGQTGYVRSDLIDLVNKTHELGFKYGKINGDKVNFRTGPSIYRFPSITTLPKGEEIVILDTVYENNSYSWIAGPLSAEFITENVNNYQLDSATLFTKPVLDLRVMERGSSGRVTMLANGKTPIPVKYPDYYRTLLGGLAKGVQSTLFDIEQTGRIEVLADGGKIKSVVNEKNQVYVLSANSKSVLAEANYNQSEYMVLDVNNNLGIKSKDQAYVLRGNGLGHGLGMSQWGAKGLAESGYTFQEILKYYYNNVELKKIY